MGETMKTSIIILTYNNLQYTRQCIESIRKNTKLGTYEIVIVDNASSDGTKEWINEQENIVSIQNQENLGFPKGCNQGIEIAKGDNILLLNNDVIVTPNWLKNMIKCLYSSEDIGAVGPVSNNVTYYQQIDVDYTSLDELNEFATKHNVSDFSKWEERIKLIGFCMLIKKSVLDKIGLLDERFSPGNFEDDDLSIRIRNEGYKNILCSDTFIHHYGNASFMKNGNYEKLLNINEEKFNEKWHFIARDAMNMDRNLLNLIKEDKSNKFKVLEIGCGCGANLLDLKNTYKNVELFGMDKNHDSLVQARKIAEVSTEDIEKLEFKFSEEKFDYIIMDNLLHLLYKPEKVLNEIKSHLTPKGKLLISVFNSTNYKFIYNIAMGISTYKNSSISYIMYDKPAIVYNAQQIHEIVERAGYKDISICNIRSNILNGEENFIEKLCQLFGEDKKQQYIIEEYIIVAAIGKEDSILVKTIKNIELQSSYENISHNIIDAINSGIQCEDIIKTVEKVSKDKVEVLNSIANILLSNKYYEHIIPLLQRAFEIDSTDKDTIYNIAFVLHFLGSDEVALKYIEMIEEKNDKVAELSNQIYNKLNKLDKAKLKFILRRIENNIEVDESKTEILEMFKNKIILSKDVIEVVLQNIIKKENVLNQISILCYENGIYDEVIPMLQKSYEINPTNTDTVYNIGYILHKFGQDDIAMKYLLKMENSNNDIKKLAEDIRGEING